MEDEQNDGEELLLDEEEVGFEDEPAEDEGETIIAFADDEREQEDETPTVKKLRDMVRERDRRLAQYRRNPPAADNADPEPEIPERPRSVADFDYDEDRFNAAIDDHLAAKEAHIAWKSRQSEREAGVRAAEEERAKRVEQQRNALGIKDFDERVARVREALSEQQLIVLMRGPKDPPRLLAALGAPGARARLDMLAAEDDLASFAVMLGEMNKEIKVTKKTAPAPEQMVRGATASLANGTDKHLERLEKEAERTGDRTKVQQYKRQLKQQKAA